MRWRGCGQASEVSVADKGRQRPARHRSSRTWPRSQISPTDLITLVKLDTDWTQPPSPPGELPRDFHGCCPRVHPRARQAPPREPASLRPYHRPPGSTISPKYSSSPMPSVSSFPMHLLSVLCTRGARRCSCDLPLFPDHDPNNSYLRSDAGLIMTPASLFDTLQTTQPFAMW